MPDEYVTRKEFEEFKKQVLKKIHIHDSMLGLSGDNRGYRILDPEDEQEAARIYSIIEKFGPVSSYSVEFSERKRIVSQINQLQYDMLLESGINPEIFRDRDTD